MVKAVIFDMDGLLVDSEPMWREKILSVFHQYGINIQAEDCIKTRGMRIDKVVEYWCNEFNHLNLNSKEVENAIMKAMENGLKTESIAMPGVIQAIRKLRALDIKMAVASSSYNVLIKAVADNLNLAQYMSVFCSAEDEVNGKPAPDVFLTAARKLKVKPEECLVFEDSETGVKAANAAHMKVIAIPNADTLHSAFTTAYKVIPSMLNFDFADLN